MSDKIRNCPLCGETPESDAGTYTCKNIACYLWGHRIPSRIWNARPVEYRLEAENKELKTRIEKLHKIAAENTIGYEAIIESLRSENEKLKEKKGIK